jgi:hypothetical protein
MNLRLPVSHGGHGLFAVENVDEKCSKGQYHQLVELTSQPPTPRPHPTKIATTVTGLCCVCLFTVFGLISLSYPSVTLAVVMKGHTINLYQLEDLQNLSSKPGTCQDLSLVPNHVLFSTQSLGAIAFVNKASLIACSPSSRTLSMWVGV